MSETSSVPTLYEWMGGRPALSRLLDTFYARVPADATLAPVFAQMSRDHAAHVADFVAEVFGGPKDYSGEHGGHPNMIRRHLGRSLTETQRKRWIDLLLSCADEVGLPADPEFRSAFVAYLEWGTRLAVLNSQPDATVTEDAPMPQWGWGEVKGPYLPSS
jgi:hemoglobin